MSRVHCPYFRNTWAPTIAQWDPRNLGSKTVLWFKQRPVGNRWSHHQSVPGAPCKVSAGHLPPSKGSGSPEGCGGKFLELIRLRGSGTALTMLVGLCLCFQLTLNIVWWTGCCVISLLEAGNMIRKVRGLSWGPAGCECVLEPRCRPGPHGKLCLSLS